MIRRTNNATYNIDKLPLEVVGMLDFLFKGKTEGFEDAYMVEIKLDDPIKHIKDGNEFFIIHSSIDQYESNAEHRWDYDWAVIHKNMFAKMTEDSEKQFKTLLKKYFETGKIAEKEDNKTNEVYRKRF